MFSGRLSVRLGEREEGLDIVILRATATKKVPIWSPESDEYDDIVFVSIWALNHQPASSRLSHLRVLSTT